MVGFQWTVYEAWRHHPLLKVNKANLVPGLVSGLACPADDNELHTAQFKTGLHNRSTKRPVAEGGTRILMPHSCATPTPLQRIGVALFVVVKLVEASTAPPASH